MATGTVPATVRDRPGSREARRDSRRPRLLILASRVPARPGDGTPGFVLTLAKALSGDFAVTVLAPRMSGAPERLRVGAVRVCRFAYFPRPLEGLADEAIMPTLRSQPWRVAEVPFLISSFTLSALSFVRRDPPDIINAHWIVPAGLAALAASRLCGVPYAVTVHGGDAYALRGGALDWLKARIVSQADAVAPVSRDIAGGLPDCAGTTSVVPMGVPVDRIQQATRQRRPEPGRLLFVGRLVDKKGVDHAVRALASLPGATLRVVGDGPQRTGLEALARRLEVSDRVDFLGTCPHQAVLEELTRAQAIVIPSRVASDGDRDGTPVVLAEAMAAGVPVIASDLGGLGEQVQHGMTGLLVRPDDPVALTATLRRSLDDPVRLEALGRRARDHAPGSELDVATTRDRYLDLLLSTVRKRGSRVAG